MILATAWIQHPEGYQALPRLAILFISSCPINDDNSGVRTAVLSRRRISSARPGRPLGSGDDVRKTHADQDEALLAILEAVCEEGRKAEALPAGSLVSAAGV
jgi:hypothetical protein